LCNLIPRESTPSFAAAGVAVSGRLTYQTSASSWHSVTTDDRFLNGSRHNPQQVMCSLLPPPSVATQNYDLKTMLTALPDITWESSLKILGVPFSNNLSASYHIRLHRQRERADVVCLAVSAATGW